MITQAEFATIYDMNPKTVAQFVSNHRGSSFIVKTKDNTLIDEYRVERMKSVKKADWLLAHENYYKIQDYGIKDHHQAQSLSAIVGGSVGTWDMFLNKDLFGLPSSSITSIVPSQKLRKYNRWAMAALLVLDRHYGGPDRL